MKYKQKEYGQNKKSNSREGWAPSGKRRKLPVICIREVCCHSAFDRRFRNSSTWRMGDPP